MSTLQPLPTAHGPRHWQGFTVLALLALLCQGCGNNHTPPQSFASPEEAVQALTGALRSGDVQQLRTIMGSDGEEIIASGDDQTLGDYASLIADERRVLVVTMGGELILLDATADASATVSRVRVFEDDVEVYSHPALVGTRLYVRGGSSVVCIDLGAG